MLVLEIWKSSVGKDATQQKSCEQNQFINIVSALKMKKEIAVYIPLVLMIKLY